MKVKSIIIIFENCEAMSFNKNVIGDIFLNDISTAVRRIACNAIEKYQVAHKIYIELFHEGDTAYQPFGIQEETQLTKFSRITQYNDITEIDVLYDNGETDCLLVDYDEDESGKLGAENLNQITYKSSLGNLYIVIEKNGKIEDYFDMEEINNHKSVEFTKEMYDIGETEYPEETLSYDNLPEFYRYIQLSERYGSESWQCHYALAVRVPVSTEESESGWKFVYAPDAQLNMPTSWQYYGEKVGAFINEKYKGKKGNFTIEELREQYPLQEQE